MYNLYVLSSTFFQSFIGKIQLNILSGNQNYIKLFSNVVKQRLKMGVHKWMTKYLPIHSADIFSNIKFVYTIISKQHYGLKLNLLINDYYKFSRGKELFHFYL
jgi:hypothetical protein